MKEHEIAAFIFSISQVEKSDFPLPLNIPLLSAFHFRGHLGKSIIKQQLQNEVVNISERKGATLLNLSLSQPQQNSKEWSGSEVKHLSSSFTLEEI